MCATPGACTSRQSTRTSKKACFPGRLGGASVCSLHCTNGVVPSWSCPSACPGLLVAKNGNPARNQLPVSKGLPFWWQPHNHGTRQETGAPDVCTTPCSPTHTGPWEQQRESEDQTHLRSLERKALGPYLCVFNWRPVPPAAAVRISKQASSTERLGVRAVATSCAGGSLRTLSLLVTVLWPGSISLDGHHGQVTGVPWVEAASLGCQTRCQLLPGGSQQAGGRQRGEP